MNSRRSWPHSYKGGIKIIETLETSMAISCSICMLRPSASCVKLDVVQEIGEGVRRPPRLSVVVGSLEGTKYAISTNQSRWRHFAPQCFRSGGPIARPCTTSIGVLKILHKSRACLRSRVRRVQPTCSRAPGMMTSALHDRGCRPTLICRKLRCCER